MPLLILLLLGAPTIAQDLQEIDPTLNPLTQARTPMTVSTPECQTLVNASSDYVLGNIVFKAPTDDGQLWSLGSNPRVATGMSVTAIVRIDQINPYLKDSTITTAWHNEGEPVTPGQDWIKHTDKLPDETVLVTHTHTLHTPGRWSFTVLHGDTILAHGHVTVSTP